MLDENLLTLENEWILLKKRGNWESHLIEIQDLKEKIEFMRFSEKQLLSEFNYRLEENKLKRVKQFLEIKMSVEEKKFDYGSAKGISAATIEF